MISSRMTSKSETNPQLSPQEILASHHQGDSTDPYLIERHLLLDVAEQRQRSKPSDKLKKLLDKAGTKLG